MTAPVDPDGHAYACDLVTLPDNGPVNDDDTAPELDARQLRIAGRLALARQLRADLERERARAELTERTRDQAARDALDAGATIAQAAEAAGVSAPRMYQIRDRRR